jgi:hypothetical protein
MKKKPETKILSCKSVRISYLEKIYELDISSIFTANEHFSFCFINVCKIIGSSLSLDQYTSIKC